MTLIVENITKSYPAPTAPLTILNGLSLTAGEGETVAIVGPSGAGKSTLLHIIGTLDKPDSGSVVFAGADVLALHGRVLARFRAEKLGFVFQDHRLLPQLTALENVLLPTLALDAPADEGRARDLLERVGVAGRALAFPAQLSGGERQRVAVARAMMNGPKLLLCDEPTGNLDHDNGLRIVGLLTEIAGQDGVTVLMVTHNTAFAARFQTVYELNDGALLPCRLVKIE